MSTDISGVDPGGAVEQTASVEGVPPEQGPPGAYGVPPEQGPPGAYAVPPDQVPPGTYVAPPGVPVPGGYTPGAYPPSAYPALAQPVKPPFWRRPVGIVLIAVGAVGLGMVLLFGVMIFVAMRSAEPLEPVMMYDFANEPAAPRTEEQGLAWDQSGGTLNLYPTDPTVQTLNFDLPASSAEIRAEATLIEPVADEWTPMMWGIAAFDSATTSGVALLCAPGGTMYLAEAGSGEPLPMGVSDFSCEETMNMNLEVRGRTVLYGPDAENMNLYSGDVVYDSFDTIAVVVYAQDSNQVLRVAKVAAFQ